MFEDRKSYFNLMKLTISCVYRFYCQEKLWKIKMDKNILVGVLLNLPIKVISTLHCLRIIL